MFMFNLLNKCYNKMYNSPNFRYNTVSQIKNKPNLTIDVELANNYDSKLKLFNKFNNINAITNLNLVGTEIDVATEFSKEEIYKRFIKKHCVGVFISCFGILVYYHFQRRQ